jgi:hypothetical protein
MDHFRGTDPRMLQIKIASSSWAVGKASLWHCQRQEMSRRTFREPSGQLRTTRSIVRLNADLVVNRSAEALFASKVSLCCLYGSVAEQELNLFQLAARRVA